MVVVAKPLLLRWWGLCSVWADRPHWMQCTGAMPYICNHTALDLGLEGTPDPSLALLTERVNATGYTGYVCPEFTALVEVITAATQPPAPTIGTVALTGPTPVTVDTAATYSAAVDGDAGDVVFDLTSTNAADLINGMEVTFTSTGERTLIATATSATASDDPQQGMMDVMVEAGTMPAPTAG